MSWWTDDPVVDDKPKSAQGDWWKSDPVIGEEPSDTFPQKRTEIGGLSVVPSELQQVEERNFRSWYEDAAKRSGLNPDPDDPRHHYDYRAAYRSGIRAPDESGHWPSAFKAPDHPNRYVNGVDTISGDVPNEIRQAEEQQAIERGELQPTPPSNPIPFLEKPLVEFGRLPVTNEQPLPQRVGSAVANKIGDFVSGLTTFNGLLGLIPSIGAAQIIAQSPELVKQVQEAEKTPAGSPERINAGLDMSLAIGTLGLIGGGTKAGLRPRESLNPADSEISARVQSEGPKVVEPARTTQEAAAAKPEGLPADALASKSQDTTAGVQAPDLSRPETTPFQRPFPEPTSIPPESARPNVASTTGMPEAFRDMGRGVSDNFYNAAFDALKSGKETISGVKDPILAKAKPFFDAGEIQTPADFKDLVQSGRINKPPVEPGISGYEARLRQALETNDRIGEANTARFRKIDADVDPKTITREQYNAMVHSARGHAAEESARLSSRESILRELKALPKTMDDLQTASRAQVEELFNADKITDALYNEYVEKWNARHGGTATERMQKAPSIQGRTDRQRIPSEAVQSSPATLAPEQESLPGNPPRTQSADVGPAIASGEAVASSARPSPEITPASTKNASTTFERESRGILEVKASKIGKSIEAKAVEAKLTQGFEGTVNYDPIRLKEQAERATSFIKSSLPNARAVIRGDAPLPEGLRGTSLITAMEEHISRQRNAELAYELANSPLVRATSEAAQEMRLMAERVPDGITAAFEEIKEARRAGSKQRGETVERVAQEIKAEVVRNSSKRPTWEAFVKSLECV